MEKHFNAIRNIALSTALVVGAGSCGLMEEDRSEPLPPSNPLAEYVIETYNEASEIRLAPQKGEEPPELSWEYEDPDKGSMECEVMSFEMSAVSADPERIISEAECKAVGDDDYYFFIVLSLIITMTVASQGRYGRRR